jgi:hypothetical protein
MTVHNVAHKVLSLFELCTVYFSSMVICIFESRKRIIFPSSLLVMRIGCLLWTKNTNYKCLKIKRPGRCFERSCMSYEICGISVITQSGARTLVYASPNIAFDTDASAIPQT